MLSEYWSNALQDETELTSRAKKLNRPEYELPTILEGKRIGQPKVKKPDKEPQPELYIDCRSFLVGNTWSTTFDIVRADFQFRL